MLSQTAGSLKYMLQIRIKLRQKGANYAGKIWSYVNERWGLVLKIIRERGSGPHFKQQSMVGLE